MKTSIGAVVNRPYKPHAARRRRAWLLLIGLGLLLIYAASLSRVAEDMELALLSNRWAEMRKAVDLMCDNLDAYIAHGHDWGKYDYTHVVSDAAARLDRWPGVFAALYDGKMTLLSERTVLANEAALAPRSEDTFLKAAQTNERKEMELPYPLPDGRLDSMRLYFRWIPSNAQAEGRLLMVVAMGRAALEDASVGELIRWCIGLLAIAAVVVVTAGVIVARTPRRREEAMRHARE